jgi:hypothetical protein
MSIVLSGAQSVRATRGRGKISLALSWLCPWANTELSNSGTLRDVGRIARDPLKGVGLHDCGAGGRANELSVAKRRALLPPTSRFSSALIVKLSTTSPKSKPARNRLIVKQRAAFAADHSPAVTQNSL